MALRHQVAKGGDRVICMAGIPFGTAGSTNVLHVVRLIGDELERYATANSGETDSLTRPRAQSPASFGFLIDAAEGRQRLPDDLVHIVVAVGREPADESDVVGRIGERLVALEQLLIFRPRDRIIRIALGRRIFVRDRRPGDALAR